MKRKKLFAVGGGNSAFEESLFLKDFASHVTILVRGDEPTASRCLKLTRLGHDPGGVQFLLHGRAPGRGHEPPGSGKRLGSPCNSRRHRNGGRAGL